MKKIKRILTLFLMIGVLASGFSAGADIIVLMDASGTILPWFDEINNRILVDITRKFVRQDDTFHLISFNSRANLEIVQPIETEADISRVVSRFMLLYPLGQNSDFLSGLSYTWQYVSSLDQARQKIVIVISDGIFNPPASSPYATFTPEQVRSELSLVARKIRGAGWNVYYIKLPFPDKAEIRNLDGNLIASPEIAAASANGKKSASKTVEKNDTDKAGSTTGKKSESPQSAEPTKKYYDVSSEFSSDLSISQSTIPTDNLPVTFVDSVFSMPEVVFPDELGHKGRIFILPLKVKNVSNSTVNMELTAVYWDDLNILGHNSFLNLSPGEKGTLRAEIHLPKSLAKGPATLPLRLQFSGATRVNPQSGTVHLTITGFSPELLFQAGAPVMLAIILILLAVLFVAALVIFVFRRTERPVTDAVQAAANESIKSEQKETIPGTVTGRTPYASATAFKIQGKREALSKAQPTSAVSASQPATAGINASNRAEILAASSVKADKKIRFNTEKDNSALLNTNRMATLQAEEKNERLSVLSSAAKKIVPHMVTRHGAKANEPIVIRENSNIMLELAVDNQNPHIGKRNIHMMKAGSRLSIGGGVSAFLIFLVKFPSNIAEIRYDGKQCDLAILKPEYFPYETQNIIENCVDREFVIVSDKQYEVAFTMKVYEDPVLKLNRILNSIKY